LEWARPTGRRSQLIHAGTIESLKLFYGKSLCRTRTPLRVPTPEDFTGYRGGHTPKKWTRLPYDWRCPSCGRSKYEQIRWTKSITGYGVPKGEYQWLAPIHEHHDHGGGTRERAPRFAPTMLCFDCNNAEGRTKDLLDLPGDFSFSPEEMRVFITGLPHCGVDIDLDAAKTIADLVLRFR
jgi:rubredoxin